MLKLIKKNLISFICILLAVVMAVGGVISYAKFMSGENLGDSTGIGLFSYSATIDGVSAMSFTNTSFWGADAGSGDEGLVAMNAIRTIDFSIKNFDGDKVNAVRTGYSITFTAPKTFAEKLAFQVIDNYTVTMTPQIVIGDILTKSSFNTMEVTDYNGDKYVGDVYDKNGNKVVADSVNGNGLYFKVTTSTVNGRTAYTATAKTPKGDFVITITQREETKEQMLQFRLWDVSSVTNNDVPTMNYEGGRLMSPLTVKVEETQIYYDITITTPDFQLPAGVATTRNHRVKLVPVDILYDNHLGGTIIDKTTGEQANALYSGQDVLVQTVKETVNTYSNSGKTNLIGSNTTPVFGSAKRYQQGNTTTVRNTVFVGKTTEMPNTADLSGAVSTTVESGWTVLNTNTSTGGIERVGDSIDSTKVTGTTYYKFTVKQETTTSVTSQQTVVTTYSFPIYESSTYATAYVTTYVVSTTENNGQQTGVELEETSSTTTTVERKPIGSVEITKTVVKEKTETTVSTLEGTAYYTRSGSSWQGYTYTLYTGTNSQLSQNWDSTPTTTTSTTNAPDVTTWTDPTETTIVPAGATTTTTQQGPVVETVYKTISRAISSTEMTIKELSYTPANDDGTYGATTVYTQAAPFKIMEAAPNSYGTYEQKYFVSQCFLKSFPLSVNMTFEQRSQND